MIVQLLSLYVSDLASCIWAWNRMFRTLLVVDIDDLVVSILYVAIGTVI